MPPPPTFRLVVMLLPLALVGWSGCASAASRGDPGQSRPAASALGTGYDSAARIQRAHLLRLGMHKPQVLDWLGEPKSTEAASNANGMRETWVYEIIHAPVYKTIAAEMEDVPYVDPFTGQLRYLKEPVLNQQRIQRFETITLSFRGPRVIDIERKIDDRSHFRN